MFSPFFGDDWINKSTIFHLVIRRKSCTCFEYFVYEKIIWCKFIVLIDKTDNCLFHVLKFDDYRDTVMNQEKKKSALTFSTME